MKKKNWAWAVCFLFFSTTLIGYFAQPPQKKEAAALYQAKDYSSLLGMEGFSDKALQIHFKLYQGYVSNTNLLYHTLSDLAAAGKNRSPEYAEIKRRFGWEFDGMRLHEFYFENLGGKGSLDPSAPLYAQLVTDFGSYEKWKADFVATGALRGIGWAVLYFDPQAGHLFNTWINEHDLGHLAGGKPILVMDVFEHAYMIDYLLDRAAYIEAFFNNINWETVHKRYTIID
ncbi:MAG TPA: superoxide dismutase [Rhabdochlamydiaceae bacterium]|nr:superoxide dismutase [Rhabdochlamydiaceae bacterium]